VREDVREHWPAISRLLDEALELDVSRRAAWLDSLPAEHAKLRPVLARLLDKHVEALQKIRTGPHATNGAMAQGATPDSQGPGVGAQVGAYRLRSLIGRGGMGTVWLAEKVNAGGAALPVAIKLPTLQGQSAQVIAERFERERQILAALNHPNIARLYEAGVSENGSPYLALEYVEGETLPVYCAQHSLTVRKRLELFLQVLKAVQYAHASLVIHRDLKPTNIIVTSTGDVKLLDFGIAKLLDPETRHAAETHLTLAYGKLMTLDYASPEQVLGEPLGTASDVYSLGVLLYELLTGTRPYKLKRGSRAELEEAILTSDTRRPSLAPDAQFATSASSSVTRLRRTLRGDLDTIVLKALDKDRAQRYQTAEAFARDCERYLERRPVLARPQSRWYRLRKFAARNRVMLTAGSAVAVALVVGLGMALWQARVATEQSRLAREEALKQQAVQSFMTSLFDRNTRLQPDAAKARNMTVRELLLDASTRVKAKSSFTGAPGVKLELLNTVASLLRDIDEYEQAAALSDEAVALATAHSLTGTDAYVEALMGQTATARLLGRGDLAVSSRNAALAALDARGDTTSLLRARASINTVAQFATDADREIQLVSQGVKLFEQRYATHPAYFQSLYYLGNLYRTQQHPVEAEANFRRAIAIFDGTGSQDFTNLGASYAFAGECNFARGHIKAALADFARGMEILERHAGASALVVRFQRAQYIQVLGQAGRPAEAQQVMDALAKSLPAGMPPSIADFDASIYQALMRVEGGNGRDAQQLLLPYEKNWLEFGRRFVPNGGKWVVFLAHAQALEGQGTRAHGTLQRIGELPPFYGVQSVDTPEYAGEAALIDMLSGDSAGAVAKLEKARDKLAGNPTEFDWTFARLQAIAAHVTLADGDPKAALEHADRSLEHLRTRADAGGFPYLEIRAQLARGEALLALGRAPEAIESLGAARVLAQQLHAPQSPWRLAIAASLAQAHAAQGQLAPARTQFAEAQAIARRSASLPAYFQKSLVQAEQALRTQRS